jgi:NAD(P)-dependent dehydrogenase (short-subunit alcohol dehydrogenase family)
MATRGSSALGLSVLGAIDSVRAVLPAMRERGRGTLLFTTGGAVVAPSAARASSAVSYAAEVAYARLLHEELSPEGIRVAHTAIVGALGPGLQHEPATVAELLWRQHAEGRDFQTVCARCSQWPTGQPPVGIGGSASATDG